MDEKLTNMNKKLILGYTPETFHRAQQVDGTTWYFTASSQIDCLQLLTVGKYGVDTLRGQLG